MNMFEGREGAWLRWGIISAVVLLAAFLLVQTMSALVGLRYIGTGVAAANTISVSGHGENLAVPDIATFNFNVVSDKPTVAAAQADAHGDSRTAYQARMGLARLRREADDFTGVLTHSLGALEAAQQANAPTEDLVIIVSMAASCLVALGVPHIMASMVTNP